MTKHQQQLDRQAEALRMIERWKPSKFHECWTKVVVVYAGLWLFVMSIAVVLAPFVLLAWIAG